MTPFLSWGVFSEIGRSMGLSRYLRRFRLEENQLFRSIYGHVSPYFLYYPRFRSYVPESLFSRPHVPDLTSRRPRSDVPTRSLSRVPRLFVNIMACAHMYPMQGTNHSTFCRSGTSRGKWLLFHRKLDKDTDLCVFMCFIY